MIVTGRLKQRSYETTEGEKRTVYEVDADDVGPSLKWATAKIAKTSRDKVPHPADGGDPWQARDRPPPRRAPTATGPRSSPAHYRGPHAHPGVRPSLICGRAGPAPGRPQIGPGHRLQKGPDVRDHSEESFSDGTPLPPRSRRAGKGKGPSQAQQLMAMAEDTYRLIRSDRRPRLRRPQAGPADRRAARLQVRRTASGPGWPPPCTGRPARSPPPPPCPTASPCWTGEASELDPRPVWLRVGQHDGTRRRRHGHRDRAVHHHHPRRLGRRGRLPGDLPPLRADPPPRPARSAAAPWTGCAS